VWERASTLANKCRQKKTLKTKGGILNNISINCVMEVGPGQFFLKKRSRPVEVWNKWKISF
jgi:hypothetical protein